MPMPPAIGHLTAGATAGFPAADVYDLDFQTGDTPATGGFAYTRASVAWDEALASYAINAPVLNATRGLYLESNRTNLYLHSTAPVTQTIASMAAATYVCWITGTGSLAVSGGVTGTATAATPFVFTLGSTLSCTFTVSGSVTYASVEVGQFPTSPIVTAGASVTRSAPPCTVTRSAVSAGTVAVRCRTARAVNTGSSQCAWQIDDGTSSNLWTLRRNTSGNLQFQRTNAGSVGLITAGALASDVDVTMVAAFAAGDTVLKMPGSTVTGTQSVPSVLPTVERLGQTPSTSFLWDRSLYRIARWSTRLPDAQLDAILATF